jgi:hypothetical protein
MTPSQRRTLVAAVLVVLLLAGGLGVRRLTDRGESAAREQTGASETSALPEDELGQNGREKARVSRLRNSSTANANTRPRGAMPSPGTAKQRGNADGDSDAVNSPEAEAALEKAANERIAHFRLFGYSASSSGNPQIDEAAERILWSRTRSDMRSMATAIESYFVDHNTYPMMTTDTQHMQVTGMSVFGQVPGPRDMEAGHNTSLTTPVAYMTTYFQDVFATNPADTFAYYAPNDMGWILFSPGPDGKFDLDWSIYDPSIAQPSKEIIASSYDATNGVFSGGDVWRVKQ